MIRRILIIVALFLPFTLLAQLGVGEWKVYNTFATSISKMLETPDKVYYLSEGCLFSYDKDTEESYCYTPINKLNDYDITGIYYNNINKYLLVAYKSGNIDLIYDNGKIINMSDIKDATMTTSKSINDVAFNDNRIYVATVFGLVIYDDQKHQVIESGIYNKDITSVAVSGGHIFICIGNSIYVSMVKDRHNTFDKFSFAYNANAFKMSFVSENKLLIVTKSGNNHTMRISNAIDFNNAASNMLTSFSNLATGIKYFAQNSLSNIYAFNSSNLYVFDEEANVSTIALHEQLKNKTISYWNDENNIWAGDVNGIGNYKVEEGNITVLHDNFKPESSTVKDVALMSVGKSGKIYFSNMAASKVYGNYDGYRLAYLNTIKDGVITNVIPTVFTESNKNNPSEEGIMCDIYLAVEDPTDEDAYYLGTYWDGIYKVKNNEQIAVYDWNTSTISKIANWSCHVPSLGFDKNNNLWAMQMVSAGTPVLHMITADKLAKGETQISDWNGILLGEFTGDKDGKLLICEKSNMIFISDGTWDSKLVAYDTKGTYEDISDDTYYIWTAFIDQDGKSIDPERISYLAEDKNGRVWIGMEKGIIEISKPANATNPMMTVNRIKVPRNDGTNLADYLLDNQQVSSIAIDNSNRKWLTTLASGIYLVSENGDEIIEHFTTDNSGLPSNRVYSVKCEPNGNSVYIGTDVGLVEYKSNSSPAETDYSNVYAYPNPVRPEYTGWITITGLMDNSLVKIADAAGNVFFTAQSEGGMVTWDGCNADGQRVKTGVYYVFASQGTDDGGSSSGAVTKILVIN